VRRPPEQHRLARDIQSHYVDALGTRHDASPEALDAIHRSMVERTGPRKAAARDVRVVQERSATRVGPAELRLEDGRTITIDSALPLDLPWGYHDLLPRRGRPARLIVAPATCHLPDTYRVWGWAIQLYAARSRRSWGIGDLSDLRRLGRWAARDRAGIALVNPLAAPAPVIPQQPSPYFPSSRRFRSPLYLRIEEIDGARGTDGISELAARARALNGAPLIDRDEVHRLKLDALERIWKRVRRTRDAALDRFVDEQGDGLREFATFNALAERFGTGWHRWPESYRHPGSAAVRRAARDLRTADRIRFHQWIQYEIDRQLERASRAMPVTQDLPIGFDADGADGWAFQDVLAAGISVGAPPDEFNTKGQNWGLPPFVPHKLRAAGYEPFARTIRGCVRHAGGLRIDHVMGLFRLFWIPAGMEPRSGAYVRSNAEELLAIVALESQRAGAVIVGEDLGTVEEVARKRLMDACVLSYRLLWFEKTPPSRFPEHALAAVTTHDLPTIAGLWTGSDLTVQKRLGLAPNEKGTRQIRARVKRLAGATPSTPIGTIVTRVHEALAAVPSRIVTATLEDAMAVEKRPNMPATTTEWPNWRLALPRPIEELDRDPLARRIARALARGRKPGYKARRGRRR
jgi:4-alpha-glucanotransferase